MRTRSEVEWLELVADVLAGPPDAGIEERVTAQLMSTFGLVGATFHFRRPGETVVQRMWPPHERFNGHRAELDHWGVHHAPTRHPLLRFYMATGRAATMQVWDVPERFADARVMAGWREVGTSWGSASQLAVPLHMSAASHRAFVMGREDPYTPGELQLARTLQRLLIGLDRHVGVFREVTGPAPATDVRLTPRELVVLGLVAEGRTAAAVARHLLIAERTVHKHLERVYAKLDVHDRLGAVLRARDLGLLAPTAG